MHRVKRSIASTYTNKDLPVSEQRKILDFKFILIKSASVCVYIYM